MPDEVPPVAKPFPPVVTLEDFDAVDFLAPLSGLDQADCHILEAAYGKAAQEAHAKNREPDLRVFRLLVSLCSLHFKVQDRAGVFGPQWVTEGQRTAIPDDWRGEQNRVFEALFSRVPHPGLRARIADVTWTNDRKAHAAAGTAIEAYCEAAEGLRNGTYRDRFESNVQASSKRST